MKVKTRSFTDRIGNRSIFPSLIVDIKTGVTSEGKSAADVSFISHQIARKIDISLDKDWLEFDDEDFPHATGILESAGFVHGGATSYVFSGPMFDKVKDQQQS